MDPVVAFTPAGARRVEQAVRAVEARPPAPVRARGFAGALPAPVVQYVRVTGETPQTVDGEPDWWAGVIEVYDNAGTLVEFGECWVKIF